MDLELIADLNFEKQDYTLKALPMAEYENCTFSNCNFSNTDLSGYIFLDCTFTSSSLMMAKMDSTALRTVLFRDCKLLGVRFDYADPFLFNVNFEKCVLNLAGFFKHKMKKARFADCTMHEVDFTQADLTQAVFHNCDLFNSVFDQTNLQKADFRTSINFSIDPLKNNLKKARFSVNGLPGLLHQFDLVID